MKSFGTSLVFTGLLVACGVAAALEPDRVTESEAARAKPRPACALVAPMDSSTQPAPEDIPRQRINIDFLFDSCQLDDTSKDTDIANNAADSEQHRYDEVNDWIEWNRQQQRHEEQRLQRAGNDASDFLVDEQRRRHGDGWGSTGHNDALSRQGGDRQWQDYSAAPEVPEPSAILMLLGGIALLAAYRAHTARNNQRR